MRHASPHVCHLEPGDMLFLPSYWWHEVYSRPDTAKGWNMAVNWWYGATRDTPPGRVKLEGRDATRSYKFNGI